MSWFNVFLKQETRSFEAGELVFEAGAPASCMYVVAEGEVEIVVGGTVVDVLSPAAIFGEMALITGEPRSATVRARASCRLVEIPEKRFLYLVHESPFFALEVMRVLTARLRRHDPS